MKRIISMLMVLLLCCSLCTPVLAADHVQPVMAAGFFQNLFGGGKDALELVDEALEKKKTKVTIKYDDWLETGYSWDDVYAVLGDRLNDTPETIHVNIRKVSFVTYEPKKGDPYIDLNLAYFEDFPAQLNGEMTKLAAQKILDKIPAGASDWEIAHFVHDELIRTVTYVENEYDQTAYGALVEGEAICNGYAMAFEYVMDMAGIPCDTVVGYTDWYNAWLAGSQFLVDDSVRHAWNVLTLTGDDGVDRQYYVDVTWDDMDWEDADGEAYIIHDWFCLDQESIEYAGRQNIYHPDGLEQWDFTDESMDYYVHTGTRVQEYDLNAIAEIMKQQMDAGKNTLSINMGDMDHYYDIEVPMRSFGGLQKLIGKLDLGSVRYLFTNDDYGGILSLHLFLNAPD